MSSGSRKINCNFPHTIRLWLKSILHELLVFVTPKPLFARFGGADHRMTRTMIMFGHVFLWRRVATERHTTGLASAQVHPLPSFFDTLFTDVRFRYFYIRNCFNMRTTISMHNMDLRFCQVFVDKADGHGTFPHRRRHPVHGTGPDIAGRKDAMATCFEQVRLPVQLPDFFERLIQF